MPDGSHCSKNRRPVSYTHLDVYKRQGLALAAQNYFGIPITSFVSVFNIGMFLVGALILGKKFAMTTILSTFYYPFILGVLQKIPQLPQTGVDMILGAVFGGCMIGIGIGIVIRCGASTGGMDIPPLLIRRFFGIPVSVTIDVYKRQWYDWGKRQEPSES